MRGFDCATLKSHSFVGREMHQLSAARKGRSASLSIKRLSAEICRYCANHPNARDSLEGIAWWLAMQHYRETKEGLEEVIDRLVKRGVLHRHELHDGSAVFGCNSGDCAQARVKRIGAKSRLRK